MTEEEKEAIEILEAFEPDDLIECSIYRKALEIIKNLVQNQDTEINKLNNVIDRITEHISSNIEGKEDVKCFLYGKIDDCYEFKNCKECIKEYFMKEN